MEHTETTRAPLATIDDKGRWKFEATVLELGSSLWMYADDLHRLKCPNRAEFAFRLCPYFSCSMTRDQVASARLVVDAMQAAIKAAREG